MPHAGQEARMTADREVGATYLPDRFSDTPLGLVYNWTGSDLLAWIAFGPRQSKTGYNPQQTMKHVSRPGSFDWRELCSGSINAGACRLSFSWRPSPPRLPPWRRSRPGLLRKSPLSLPSRRLS